MTLAGFEPEPYPTPDSKSPCKGLSESVVGFYVTFHFTRLDSGEQWSPNSLAALDTLQKVNK